MVWSQVYDPMGNIWLSALLAAIPVVVMLGCIAFGHMKAHYAAGLGLASALLVAIFGFGMPAGLAWNAAGYGAAFGLLPIGWIVLNIIFLHQLTIEDGSFSVLQDSLTGISDDRRIQLLLIAFCFGAFFEGAAGFGTPVAVTAAIMIGLGFSPLAASGLCLIANTAPVAYGALGTPVIALAAVTGIDLMQLSGMIGRQLPLFSLLVPFWLIWAFAGFRGMIQIWPAILVAGLSFAIPQYLVSNFHGPWLVDVVAAIVSMISLVLFLKVWKPKKIWTSTSLKGHENDSGTPDLASEKPHGHEADAAAAMFKKHDRRALVMAWMPWVILTVFVFIWGIPDFKKWVDGISVFKIPFTGLHNLVEKVAPVVAKPHKEAAIYTLNWLSATGTGIFLAAMIGGLLMKYSLGNLVRIYLRTIWLVRYSLLTIVLMLALGLPDALFRHRCDTGTGIRPYRHDVPDFRHPAGLARGRADRFRHRSQCAVRWSAEDYRRATGPESGADGSRQQFRRRDGQDGRCPEHRGRQYRNPLVRPRRRHPALRVLPQPGTGGAGRDIRLPAGLRLSVHRIGTLDLTPGRAAAPRILSCHRK